MPWNWNWRPTYYRRWRQTWRRPRTRRWLRYRRPRTTIRRRYTRRKRTRVRRRRFFRKKLQKITVKQFQPSHIRHCTVKGMKCLYMCDPKRTSSNYAQYILSYTPEHFPTGGGWSLMVFSLGSLWEDYEHLRNYWSNSNAGLPLVRYQGCSFKFYQHSTVDYVVTWRTCYPMTDTQYEHPNSQPSRMLMAKKKLIVPSMKTKLLKKRYKRKFFRPPAQMQNRWYFQKHICNVNLLMLTTTSCNLTDYYLSPFQQSNNVTWTCLNTKLFQNHNFQNPSATTGYTPKNNTYLYGSVNGSHQGVPNSIQSLIYLGNTKDYQAGEPFPAKTSSTFNYPISKWGNPFFTHYLNPDKQVYYGTVSPETLWSDYNTNKTKLTPLTQPYYIQCRYAPDKDTGEGNEAYFVKNYDGNNWEQPENLQAKIDGFPLWIMLWGWPDWIKKLRPIQRVDKDHIIVIKSKFFDTELPAYIPLDYGFIHGLGLWPDETNEQNLSLEDKQHWYPKFLYQQDSIDKLCKSGPAVAKSKTSFEAHCEYKFRFKWGGCPATIEKIYDPCSQPDWPIPNNQLSTIPINDPATSPEKMFYEFDMRRDILTKKAIERIQKHAEPTDSLSKFETGDQLSKYNPATEDQTQTFQNLLETLNETSDEEKETTTQEQLKQHRNAQRLLKRRIYQLLKYNTKNIE
nr:MAG: ORF1 [TTV-like mini virus]